VYSCFYKVPHNIIFPNNSNRYHTSHYFEQFEYGDEIKQYLDKLYETEEELDELKLTTSEKSEVFKQIEHKLKTIKNTIEELIVNVRKNILVLKEAGKTEADKFNKQLSAMPKQERQKEN
jgi:ribosomal protein S8